MGLESGCALQIDQGRIIGNIAGRITSNVGASGAGFKASNAMLQANNTLIANNNVLFVGVGGGVYVAENSSAVFTNCQFLNNSATVGAEMAASMAGSWVLDQVTINTQSSLPIHLDASQGVFFGNSTITRCAKGFALIFTDISSLSSSSSSSSSGSINDSTTTSRAGRRGRKKINKNNLSRNRSSSPSSSTDAGSAYPGDEINELGKKTSARNRRADSKGEEDESMTARERIETDRPGTMAAPTTKESSAPTPSVTNTDPAARTLVQVQCESCVGLTYNLQGGYMEGWEGPGLDACLSCPFGGDCLDSTIIVASRGFWGQMLETESQLESTVMFTTCPVGYCVGDSSSEAAGVLNQDFLATDADDINTCMSGRNGSIPLCGGCLDGYSQALFATACVDDCDSFRWFWPLAVAYVAVLVT